MIKMRAPLRVSFVGGGTDLPAFYENDSAGAVVSCAIQLYVYASLHDDYVGEATPTSRMNALAIAVLTDSGYDPGRYHFELTSDTTSSGSGLGASSAAAVAMLSAVRYHQCKSVTKPSIAARACEIEIARMEQRIGKQDQYASAIGGFNFMEFTPSGEVRVENLSGFSSFCEMLETHSMLFDTGLRRSASNVLGPVVDSLERGINMAELRTLRDHAHDARDAVRAGDLAGFLDLINRGWTLKRRLARGISVKRIDESIHAAMASGASACKLLGAGGGGHLLICADPCMHDSIRTVLGELRELPFVMDYHGLARVS